MNKTVKLIVKLIMAYITTVVLGLVSGYGITHIDWLLPMVFACVLCIFIFVDTYGKKKDSIYGWVMGSIVSTAYVIGKHVVINDNEGYVSDFSVSDIVSVVVLADIRDVVDNVGWRFQHLIDAHLKKSGGIQWRM